MTRKAAYSAPKNQSLEVAFTKAQGLAIQHQKPVMMRYDGLNIPVSPSANLGEIKAGYCAARRPRVNTAEIGGELGQRRDDGKLWRQVAAERESPAAFRS